MSNDNYSRRDYVKLSGSAAAAGLTGLAGCTGGGDGNGSNGSGSGGMDVTESDSGGNSGSSNAVTAWSGAWSPSDNPNFVEYVKSEVDTNVEFTEMRYDQINQKYLTGADTGTPDVVETNPQLKTAFVKSEQVEPITDRVEELDHSDGYIGLDTMRHQDEIWALPWIGNGRGHVYRQDILDKYGWDVPSTWEEHIEISSEITKNEEGMYGFTLTSKKGNGRVPQEFLAMLFQRVDDIFVYENGQWNLNATAEDLGVVLKSYYWDPFFKTDPPATNPDARGIGSLEHDIAYVNGNYASLQTGPWLPGVASTSDSVESTGMENYRKSAVTHNPTIPGGEQATFREVQAAMMNPAAESKEDAWAVLQHSAGPEGIRQWLNDEPGNMPAHEDVEWKVPEQTDNPDWAGFQDVFESGKSYGFWSVTKAFPGIQDATQQVMYDQTDPMKAGEQLYEEWKSLEGDL